MPSRNGKNGALVSREAKKRPPMGEQGAFGTGDLTTFEGQIYRLDSREFRKGPKSPTVFDLELMMDTDGQAMGLQRVITQPILACVPRIEAADGDRGEADFVRHVFLKDAPEGGMLTPTPLLIAQACGAFARRKTCWEKVWKIQRGGPYDGFHVYDKLAFRRASTCTVKEYDGRLGYVQEGYRENGTHFKKEFLPNKALVYVHGASATKPLGGESAFEAAYHDYDNKRKLKLLYFMYLQKFGIPPLVGGTDDPTEKGQEAMLEKLEAIRAGAAIVKGPGETFETLTAADTIGGASGGSADFREAFRYLDSQMATSMLAGFIQLPVTNQTGSYALSRDQSDLFLLSLEAKQREVEAVMTSAATDLVTQNYGSDAAFPRFKMTALSQEHEAAALDLLKALLSTGAAPPISLAQTRLILKKGLARLDITEDQIAAAEEEVKEEQAKAEREAAKQQAALPTGVTPFPQAGTQPQAPTAGAQPPSGGNVVSIVKRLQGGGAPAQAQAQLARVEDFGTALRQGSDEEPRELASIASQIRGPDGTWIPAGPGSAGGTSRSTASRARGGAVGAHKKDPRPKATPKAPSKSAKAASVKPEGEATTKVVLPAGETVLLEAKPPADAKGPHFCALGTRGGVASALHWLEIVSGRQITPDEAALVAQNASSHFDSGLISILGRYQAGALALVTLNAPAPTELAPMIGLAKTAYGPIAQSVTLDGQAL